MGYWIHVDEIPIGGGGGGSDGPNGCIGCLGILAVIFGLWFIKENFVSIMVYVLFFGGLASAFGIIYILKETSFDKTIVIAGIIGFAAGACFTNNILGLLGLVVTAVGGHILMGLILAVAAMFIASFLPL